MSEIDKNKQQEDIIDDSFNDDDLWQSQSSESASPLDLEGPELEELKENVVDEGIGDESDADQANTGEEGGELEENDQVLVEVTNVEENEDSPQEQDMVVMEDSETQEQLNNLPLEEDNSDLNEVISNIRIDNQEEEIKSISQDLEELNDDGELNELVSKKDILISEIQHLLQQKDELINEQKEVSQNLSLLVKEGLTELEDKKQNLEIIIQKLERRKERIENEMKTTFSGISQDLAIRVQGFKDYLVGSLQDLAIAAEQLDLNTGKTESWETSQQPITNPPSESSSPQFVEKSFQEETRIIRSLLDQYRTKPDYYGPPWQLRRTFEPIHAQRVSDWFFTQGGRGALKTMTSRLQNILVTSAIISILSHLYGDRARVLILSDTPEKLGEWRRGLQDCLGISRSDFGPNRGVVLFETPEALCQKAERIMDEKDLPLVIMDQNEDKVNLSLLQFPLWLAFAPEKPTASYDYF